MKTKVFEFTPTSLEINHDFKNIEDYGTEVDWVARGTLVIDHGRHINFTFRSGSHMYWDSQHALQPEQRQYIEGVFRSYVNAVIVKTMQDARMMADADFEKAIEEAAIYASSSVGRTAS